MMGGFDEAAERGPTALLHGERRAEDRTGWWPRRPWVEGHPNISRRGGEEVPPDDGRICWPHGLTAMRRAAARALRIAATFARGDDSRTAHALEWSVC